MAFNGAGTYNRIHDWQDDADNAIGITPDRHDAEDDGFATGLSNCMTRDGQSPATANIPYGGFRATGLGAGVASTDAATVAQIQSNASAYAATTGSANAYVLTLSPAITAYAAGQDFTFKANFTNSAAATINISALGVKSLVRQNSAALIGGEILSGSVYKITYDGTNFQIQGEVYNPTGGLSTIASATATDLGTLTTNLVSISGTTTITGFGSSATLSNPLYFIRFIGILTLTYNASSLIIPGAANITTAAGDSAIVEYLGSGNWKVHEYTKLSALPLITTPVASGGTGLATLTAHALIAGNGASTPNFIAPGTSGNVLSSDGTDFASVALSTLFSQSLGTIGSIRLGAAGSLIIKWGQTTDSGASGTVTFAVAFPSTCYAVVACSVGSGARALSPATPSASAFTWTNAGAGQTGIGWVAFGV